MNRVAILAFVLFCLAAPAHAAIQQMALSAEVRDQTIAVTFYRPDGKGPFPLIVLSHGVPRESSGFAGVKPTELRDVAMALARRGIAVAVPLRRGYGGQGRWVEGYGGCETGDFYTAGLTGANDIDAAIKVATAQPDVDATRVVLMGVSGGGWASVADATRGGVMGVVSFAGGRGNRGYEQVCQEDKLVEAAGRFGAATHVPELWIYSVNDHVFPPDVAQRMFKAFQGSGAVALFQAAPPYGREGHAYIENVSSWWDTVHKYLVAVHFMGE